MQSNRSNAGGLVAGALLIAFGLLMLAGRVFRFWDWGNLWPFFVIGAGALFFLGMFAGGRRMAGLAIPGSIIGGTGLVLLYQNMSGRWESMAYFWTLIVLFVGAGIFIMGWHGGNPGQRNSGAGVMKVGVVLFIVFGAFFELIFSSFGNLVFPILLILLGGYLVLSRSGLLRRDKKDSPDSVPPSA